jgi:hypothetical protein
MSRVTRDQQFKKTLDNCMTNFTDTYYPNTTAWELDDLTNNKNKSIQQYSLKFPRKRISYTIDSHTRVDTGSREPSELVEIEQDIPEIDDLQNLINLCITNADTKEVSFSRSLNQNNQGIKHNFKIQRN